MHFTWTVISYCTEYNATMSHHLYLTGMIVEYNHFVPYCTVNTSTCPSYKPRVVDLSLNLLFQ